MKKRYTPKKLGIMAVFISVGLALQYVEGQMLITSVPGGKLGLANIVSIINIFMFGGQNAAVIATIRACLGALVTSGAVVVPYSAAGALCSTGIMWLVKRLFYPKVSMIGIGIAGAVVHNIAQLIVAFVQYGSVYVFSYMPVLLIIGLVSGTVTGCAAGIIAKRILKEAALK